MQQDNLIQEKWILDELDEIIYISDTQDYTLLFLNRAGRELTGQTPDGTGDCKCYKVLQGRDSPCPFCTNAKLKKEEFYVWEYENDHLHRNFIVKDKLVDWNGRTVRMEIAVDVGDMMTESNSRTSKYHMETVMLETLRVLNTAPALEEAINRTLELIAGFYGGERAYIVEIDRNRADLCNTYEWCREGIPSQKAFLQHVPLDAIPYISDTFNKKHHLIISNVEELKESCPSEYSFLVKRNARSLFAVPFEDESSYIGYIGVDNPNINQDTIKLLDSIAYNIANEIKKRRLYERLEYDAGHDSLSGLLNRGSFVRYREELLKKERVSCGIVAGDINDLKQLNQDYGHSKGDMTITNAAVVMTSVFMDGAVFRLSGDEFVIISQGLGYEEFMRRVNGLEWELEKNTPNGVSLGCTWEEHLTDFDRLLRHAEELMLVNKQLYYKENSHARKHYSPEGVKQLIKDMEDGCYKLYLQPKYNPLTGQICSAEALVRYQFPGKDSVTPMYFVPLLEKRKLIRYLDFYMLEQVFKLLSDWKAKGRKLLPISVNFSRITLLERDLFKRLTDMKNKYNIPARLVMIEITESIGDIERKVIESIGSKLRRAGFRISLDDFGSDYANMSILTVMQFDEVKLDKSLIDDLVISETNQTVVKCIIEMCHSLRVECVAEGVENQEQLELLASFGCTSIQGYYYSRPLEIGEFEKI